ncbi:MAG TPA: PAS domain S-box protein [Verrucomicrobiae bacterium]|jgi:PAS domain S-box-containing protein|nr:PAS domain S-box protein [Verrucomicrobiae bacterium]
MPAKKTSLEALVEARTAELHQANKALQEEIGRRTEVEGELRRSWEYFRLIVEAAPVGVVMVNQQGAITLVNDQACAIFGYTFEELVGQDLEVLIPARHRAHHKLFREAFAAEHSPRRMGRGRDLPGLRKDGREILLEIDLTVLRSEAGVYAMASISDVTERRENQQNLQRLAAIVQSSDDAIISKTLEGIVTSWNPGATRLFGYTAEEMVGQPIGLLFPPDRAAEEIDILKRVREGLWVDHFETVRLAKNGLLIDVSVTVSPMRDAEGRVVGAAKIARDITERKQAMNALRTLNEELEERVDERTTQLTKAEVRARSQAQLLEAVFHNMAEGVTVTDAAGRLTHFNAAAERLLGDELRAGALLTAAAASGLFRADHTTPFPPDELPMTRALRGEKTEPTEIFARPARRREGALLSANARPMLDATGAVRGVVSVFHDITERKKSEELVAASLREKEALLREIHHRVKNNMQIISSILRLQGHYIKDVALQEVFKDCQGRIRTMALIHEMLYQSKSLARIDFKAYLQSLAGMLLRSQTHKELTLRHQFDLEPLDLSMDLAIPVGLIANEILTNCLKHAFAGREKGLVRIALKSHDLRQVQLVIADDGCGLPPGFALEKSTSLGLRLVKILTDQIKGRIAWTNSTGAEFVLTFQDNAAVPTPPAAA